MLPRAHSLGEWLAIGWPCALAVGPRPNVGFLERIELPLVALPRRQMGRLGARQYFAFSSVSWPVADRIGSFQRPRVGLPSPTDFLDTSRNCSQRDTAGGIHRSKHRSNWDFLAAETD
jgi:hypothetical protein